MINSSSLKKDPSKGKKAFLDINCDIGQSFGVYRNEQELELLKYSSSVNISCGAHAGDPLTITKMLKLAYDNNLAVGAHVGYPDIQGFGYRQMNLTEDEIKAAVVYQIGAISAIAKLFKLTVEHVRVHGSMYVQLAKDKNTAMAVAKAIAEYDPWLVLVAPPCENLVQAGMETNIRIAREIQLDKAYDAKGNIDFDAGDIVDMDYSLNLLNSVVNEGAVINSLGGKTKLDIKTVHLSMKYDFSLELAKKVYGLIGHPIPVSGTFVANCDW